MRQTDYMNGTPSVARRPRLVIVYIVSVNGSVLLQCNGVEKVLCEKDSNFFQMTSSGRHKFRTLYPYTLATARLW